MTIELATKIVNCKNQIAKNNKMLFKLAKENERLFSSLIEMLGVLPEELKARYDKELASDNWKKYSKTQGVDKTTVEVANESLNSK